MTHSKSIGVVDDEAVHLESMGTLESPSKYIGGRGQADDIRLSGWSREYPLWGELKNYSCEFLTTECEKSQRMWAYFHDILPNINIAGAIQRSRTVIIVQLLKIIFAEDAR